MNPAASRVLFDRAIEGMKGRVAESRGWVIHSCVFPLLDISFTGAGRGELRLKMRFDDWNDSPPTVELAQPDGTAYSKLPARRPGGSDIFNDSSHPKFGRPFICMPGVREYHEHPSHLNEPWSARKALDSFSLGELVTQIWRGWETYWP